MKFALFVTWTKGKSEALRGCIGTFSQTSYLSQLLSRYALISALQDDRFSPVKLAEVPQLNVGLSLLVNFQPIQNPLDWVVGKHGVEIDFTIKGQAYSSTFLPEVMSEQGWDQKTTLNELIEKAGYDGTYDKISHLIQAKTYESIKYKMTYADFLAW